MNGNCALCPSSLFYYAHSETGPTARERHELFHQRCSACSLSKPQEDFLCDICQHLRLGHLVKCVKPETRMRYLFPLPKVLAEDGIGTKCPLCRFVNHMIVVGLSAELLSQVKKADYDIVLYLGLPQVPQLGSSSIPSADIYVSYSDGDGVSNTWVGDLHIDDIKDGKALSNIHRCFAKRIKDYDVPHVKEMVSWSRLTDTINECYVAHSECQHDVKSGLPNGFRVIDVKKRCLVEKSNCRFVALSYVWGLNAQSFLLAATRATIYGMKKEGGLPTSGMPQTIEDAISVCIQMGQSYLWADRLCIIQDDGDDKKNQIEAMDDIYSSALIVLVAAYGDSMSFGIPGVGYPRKEAQYSEDIFGLRIVNIVREVEEDSLNIWDTRGWTYQESVLSRRRLYFTNTRAFFECERLICHEDQFNPETSRDELISTRLTITEDESRFQSFARHLRHYTSRKLTYRQDAYGALYGITKSLYNGTDTMINGLPRVDFDRSLLWYTDIGKNPITRLETQGVTLPTWSWSSIMGLSDQVQYQATSFYGTLSPWYHVNGPLPSGSIEALNIHPDSTPDDDWQVYMAIACRDGCLENTSFHLSLASDNFSAVRDLFNTRWKDYRTFCKDAIPLSIKVDELPHDVITQNTKPGVIATRCPTTFLSLAPKPTYFFNILNLEGERIGELCGDAAHLREQATSPGYDKSIKFEFIALSLSGIRIMPYSSKELGPKNYIDADDNSLAKVPIVNVLMIAREGSFAHRRELGWVHLMDWAKLRREWKVVVLE